MLVDPVQWGFGIVWVAVAVAAYLDARQRAVDHPKRVGLVVLVFGALGALWYLLQLRPDDDTHTRTRDSSTVTLPSAADDDSSESE